MDLEAKCRELDPRFVIEKAKRRDYVDIVCSMRVGGRPISFGCSAHLYEEKKVTDDLLAESLNAMRRILELDAMPELGTCDTVPCTIRSGNRSLTSE